MHDRARKTEASRTLATVQSASELSEAARSEVVEALGARKGLADH
jgi:hypothetical protein